MGTEAFKSKSDDFLDMEHKKMLVELEGTFFQVALPATLAFTQMGFPAAMTRSAV